MHRVYLQPNRRSMQDNSSFRSGVESLLMEFIFRNQTPTLVPEIAPPSLETYNTIRPLNFAVASTDGGQYSSDYECVNMLRPDNSVYSTRKRENINVILKFDEPGIFVLTHVVVKAPDFRYEVLMIIIGTY